MSDLSMQIFNFLSNFKEFCVVVPELLSFIGICLFLGYRVFAAGRVRSSILVQDNLVACRVFNFILFGVFYWVVLLLFVNIAAPSIFLFEGRFLFSEAGFYVKLWIIISFYVVSKIFVFPVWGGRLNTYEVILIFMFMLFFSFLVINSFDLFILFLNFEGLSFCFYVLLMLGPRIFISIEAALKYFCLSGLTGSIFLYGISILYGLFGDVGFICLRLHFADSSLGVVRFLNVGLFKFALACVFFGFFFKLSIFPCHL